MAWSNKDAKADIVLDIETVSNPVEQHLIDTYIADYPGPPSTYKKEEVIAKHKEKYIAGATEALAKDLMFSIGGKRMISCALGQAVHSTQEVKDIVCYASDDLSVVTKGIVEYLNGFSDYRLIGWNHKNFDLPEIVKSMFLTGVKPNHKPSKWDIIDLCQTFPKTKLKDCAKAFGLSMPETRGGDVAQLYLDGDWESIKTYNESDVRITGQIYIAASNLLTLG